MAVLSSQNVGLGDDLPYPAVFKGYSEKLENRGGKSVGSKSPEFCGLQPVNPSVYVYYILLIKEI